MRIGILLWHGMCPVVNVNLHCNVWAETAAWFIIRLGNCWALWSSGSPQRFRDGWPWISLSSCRSETWGRARLWGAVSWPGTARGPLWGSGKAWCVRGFTALFLAVGLRRWLRLRPTYTIGVLSANYFNNGISLFRCGEWRMFLILSAASILRALCFPSFPNPNGWLQCCFSSVQKSELGQYNVTVKVPQLLITGDTWATFKW